MRGSGPEGRRRRSVQVTAGPNRQSRHLKGLARAALEVLTYRLRPEGSFPRMSTYLLRLY
jgi:hypothetical protein